MRVSQYVFKAADLTEDPEIFRGSTAMYLVINNECFKGSLRITHIYKVQTYRSVVYI